MTVWFDLIFYWSLNSRPYFKCLYIDIDFLKTTWGKCIEMFYMPGLHRLSVAAQLGVVSGQRGKKKKRDFSECSHDRGLTFSFWCGWVWRQRFFHSNIPTATSVSEWLLCSGLHFCICLGTLNIFFIMVRGISSSVHQKNTHVNNILWTKFKSKIWTPAFALNLWFLTIQRRRPSIIQLPSRRGHYELLMCVLPCPLLSLCLSVCLCISFLRLSFSLLWAAELYCFFWAYIWLHLVLFV